jgi:hypothetical protein
MTDDTRIHAPDETPEERRIGELVRRHADHYHDPPPTPREAIWARIEAERGTSGTVLPLTRGPRPGWWLGALAMAAVLAIGIALGRISMRDEAERRGAAGPPVASREVPAAGQAPEAREPETGARPELPAPGEEGAAAEGLAVAVPASVPAARPEVSRPAMERAAPAARRAAPAEPRDLYRLASQQMLGQAESLLAQYRADRAAERIDPAIGRWARDVLGSTRLLLDSPASDDPEMLRLLEDLELVLAQIVQRTGQADPLEDEMIERTIEDRDLMPRLRGAVPVGVGYIGTI